MPSAHEMLMGRNRRGKSGQKMTLGCPVLDLNWKSLSTTKVEKAMNMPGAQESSGREYR